jgi:hypothetical protein
MQRNEHRRRGRRRRYGRARRDRRSTAQRATFDRQAPVRCWLNMSLFRTRRSTHELAAIIVVNWRLLTYCKKSMSDGASSVVRHYRFMPPLPNVVLCTSHEYQSLNRTTRIENSNKRAREWIRWRGNGVQVRGRRWRASHRVRPSRLRAHSPIAIAAAVTSQIDCSHDGLIRFVVFFDYRCPNEAKKKKKKTFG